MKKYNTTFHGTWILAIALLLLSNIVIAQEYRVTGFLGKNHLRHGNKQNTLYGGEAAYLKFNEYVKPKVGLLLSSKHLKYAYLGIDLDFPIPETQFIIRPGFAAGAYSKGNDKKLGGVLEFQSSISIVYQISQAFDAGLIYAHLSNAGIYKRNPGSEYIMARSSFSF